MTQHIYKILLTLRKCVSFSYIFKQNKKKSFKAMYDTFGQVYDLFFDFKRRLHQLDTSLCLLIIMKQIMTKSL